MKHIERLKIRDAKGGAVIAVKVVPGSSRDRIVGILGDALKITTSTAPEKGKANAAVAKMLSCALNVDLRDVELICDTSNPRKEFLIAGLPQEQVRQRLNQ